MKWRIIGLSIVIVFTHIFYGCGGGDEKQVGEEEYIPVRVIKASTGKIENVLSFTGNIEPWRRLNILPEVGGKIEHIYVEIGDRVKEGTVLAELDRETFELRLKQAEAGLAVAKSAYEDAKRNYQRAEELWKSGSMSQQQFEKIQLAYNSAKSQLQQAEAGLDLAKWQMKVSIMRAPFSGIISGKYLSEGDMINPQMPGAPGVLTLIDISKVKIKVNASEEEVIKIRNGQSALIKVRSYPDREFNGEVYAVNSAANPITRTFEVQIAVKNSGEFLKAGGFARVKIITDTKDNVIVVPTDVLLGTERDRHVYIVEGQQALKRFVQLGIIQNGLAEIVSGLKEGELVVASGQQMLQHGSRIRVVGGE